MCASGVLGAGGVLSAGGVTALLRRRRFGGVDRTGVTGTVAARDDATRETSRESRKRRSSSAFIMRR